MAARAPREKSNGLTGVIKWRNICHTYIIALHIIGNGNRWRSYRTHQFDKYALITIILVRDGDNTDC